VDALVSHLIEPIQKLKSIRAFCIKRRYECHPTALSCESVIGGVT
jgi:hypothetical protein